MDRPTAPTRRAVLAGAAGITAAGLSGVGLSACDAVREPSEPEPPPRDVVLADQAAERERVLLAAYDVAIERAPELAERLLPLRAHHLEHLALLGVPDEPTPASDPAASPDAPDADGEAEAPADAASDPDAPDETSPPASAPPRRPAPPPLPDDAVGLLIALADLERSTAALHAGAAVRSGRGLAVALATAAASEASHPVALQ